MSRPVTPHAAPTSTENTNGSQNTQGRLMQVKVLYTFDDSNKSNCLARCSHPLNIRTAYLDPSAEIGIIELRTCVQAIVAASPELIAKLGQDYTVYAYDYSEYETPLVGQGMLSWVLASASTTPMAPAQQSRTMVTGRVCKNILGLFSDGVKETLEVKLRLIPVPTCLQSEYLASMEKYRDASSLASEGIDADAWRTFLRANPGFGIVAPSTDAFSPSENQTNLQTYPPMDTFQTGPSNTRGELDKAVVQTIPNQLQWQANLNSTLIPQNMGGPSLNTSRPTTPSGQGRRKQSGPSRPSSRASNRGSQAVRPRVPSRASSFQRQEPSGGEDGPNRKRARTVKADWNGPAALGNNTESLRVTASVAASIRSHDVTRTHPTASELAAGEFGIRPPTPRPAPLLIRKQSEVTRQNTSLSHETIPLRSEDYVSPYPLNFYGSVLTSPEGANGSVSSTPQDMPSSPPVPRNRSVTPSSPALPRYVDQHDSGFMSGPLDDCSGDDEDEIKVDQQYQRKPQTLPSELSITREIPGDPSLLPRTISARKAPLSRRASTISNRNVRPNISSTSSPKPPFLPVQAPSALIPSEIDENHVNMDKNEPDAPATTCMPGAPCPRSHVLLRSDSCMSDTALPPDSMNTTADNKPNTTKRNAGSSMKRKKAIQERLASSIAAGQMPPFCRNCGEISTPTWRKAFVRVEVGSPDSLQLSDNDEGIITYEPVTKDDDGTVTSYRIIKKMISAEEKDFEEVQLCNPCGIWLFKWRVMRPPEQWTKTVSQDIPKRRRSSKKVPRPMMSEAQSEAQSEFDPAHLLPTSDGHKPDDLILPIANDRGPQQEEPRSQSPDKENQTANTTNRPSPTEPREMEDHEAAIALRKAFQSSPPRFPGSKHSPIDLDADQSPQPVRRLLFPSPRRPGEAKSLVGLTLEGRDSSDTQPTVDFSANIFGQEDKENLPPAGNQDEERLDRLFEQSETLDTPHTPKMKSVTPPALQTPIRSTKKQTLMPNEFLTPTNRSGDPRTTPNRGSVTGLVLEEMTPFTAQLTQLISEAGLDGNFGAGFGDADMFGLSSFGAADMGVFESPPVDSSPPLFSLYEDPAEGAEASWEGQFLGDEIEVFLGTAEGGEGDVPTGAGREDE